MSVETWRRQTINPKFRVFDKNLKGIFDVLIINFGEKNLTYNDYSGNVHVSDLSEHPVIFDDIHLMQFTGFKDSRGNYIYEGDIVEGDFFKVGLIGQKSTITKDGEKARMFVNNIHTFSCYLFQFQSILNVNSLEAVAKKLEVVSTIHDYAVEKKDEQ